VKPSFRWWLVLAAGLFVLGMVLGVVLPGDGAGSLLSEELAAIEQLAGMLTPFTATMAVFIFFKNVMVLLVSFMFSPFLCLLPAGALLLNGGILSFVGAAFIREGSLGTLLAAVLPHGIFEIPAIVIGEAAAMSFGYTVLAILFSRGDGRRFFPGLKRDLRYLGIACAILAPAAVIETYATPLLLY